MQTLACKKATQRYFVVSDSERQYGTRGLGHSLWTVILQSCIYFADHAFAIKPFEVNH